MSTAQRVVKNFFSLLFSGIITQALDFAAIVYLAWILGPADFGKINFAIALIAYFTMAASLGLPLLGSREIARDKKKLKEYTGNILMLRLCLTTLSFGFLLLMSLFLNKPPDIKYLIILYGLGLIPSALLLDWVFQGIEKMEYIGLGRILSTVIYISLILYFVRDSAQLSLVPCFQVIGNFIVAVFLLYIFVRNFGRPLFTFNLTHLKNLLYLSLPIGFTTILNLAIYNIDTLMLGFMRTDAEVGYYNATYKIMLLLIAAGAAYFDVIFPLTSTYYKISLDSLKKLQSFSAKLSITVAMPLIVGGTILAKPIMDTIYGIAYDEGIRAFQILIWVPGLIYINMVYGRGLWSCNRQKELLKIMGILSIVNIALNLVLIPQWGITGAAIATVLAELIALPLQYAEFSKVVSIPFHSYIAKPLFASIIMGLFTHYVSSWTGQNIFLLIPSGVFVYLGVLFLIKGITKEEIGIIQSSILLNRVRGD